MHLISISCKMLQINVLCNMAMRGLTDIASYMHDCRLKCDFISLYTRPNSARQAMKLNE